MLSSWKHCANFADCEAGLHKLKWLAHADRLFYLQDLYPTQKSCFDKHQHNHQPQ